MSIMSNLQVEVYSAEKYLMAGVASNITLSGMYIACDSDLLKTGSLIDIKYQLNTSGLPHKYSVGGMVKETLPDGVMVGFHKFDNNTFCCVRDFILQPAADLANSVDIDSSTAGMRNMQENELPIKYGNGS